MLEWVSGQLRLHPVLAAAVAVYLSLSGVETARRIYLADPVDRQDSGFSSWRQVSATGDDAGVILFRWSDARSTMLRPVRGAVLGLLVLGPSADGPGTARMSISIDGEPVDSYVVRRGQTYSFRYYLPPILGEAKWSEAERLLLDSARTSAESDEGSPRWRELNPWRRPPKTPSIAVETTVVSDISEGAPEAARRHPLDATVGIAAVEWLDELPPAGTGFHSAERDTDGGEYRWTRRWATLPLVPRGSEAVLRVRALHPDAAAQPVTVDLFWGAELVRTASLPANTWTEVVAIVPADAGAGVLSIRVSRTWSPAAAGVSSDSRDLGVALGAVTWR